MKLGVIGCGKMGSALVEGIVDSGVCSAKEVFLFDSYLPAAQSLAEKSGGSVLNSGSEVAAKSEVILICVKPQGLVEMLAELGDCQDRLLISIAAGVKIGTIESAVDNRHRVIRVMPNTPSLVGKGAAGFSRGTSATQADADATTLLLSSVGVVCEVAESDLDAVTALSGSGPAYIFLLIEALVAAATDQGLSRDVAMLLAVQTVEGAATMVRETGENPTVLRENVTSPNGTTFAALESFRENDLSKIVKQALDSAKARSVELGNG